MLNTLAFIEWLGVSVLPETKCSTSNPWPQLKSPLLQQQNAETQSKLNRLLDGYNSFEQTLKYQFQDKSYLLRAVTHDSFTSNDLTLNYKCLDFIGDAIFNYAIVRHIFRDPANYPAKNLQHSLQLLTSNSNLAVVSIRNQFYKYLRYTSPALRNEIAHFVAYLSQNKCKPIHDVSFMCHAKGIPFFECKLNGFICFFLFFCCCRCIS